MEFNEIKNLIVDACLNTNFELTADHIDYLADKIERTYADYRLSDIELIINGIKKEGVDEKAFYSALKDFDLISMSEYRKAIEKLPEDEFDCFDDELIYDIPENTDEFDI